MMIAKEHLPLYNQGMKIDIHTKSGYQILKFEEDLQVISDLSELKFLIEGYLKRGRRFIAIGFTTASYIYSGALAVLIDSHKKIVKEGGDLCIIEPNQELLGVFNVLNVDKILHIYPSEAALPIIPPEKINGNPID
jgi:anti-anti-sigma factor